MEFFLNKEIIYNKILSDEAVLTYVALRGVLAHDRTAEYISLNRLAFILLGPNQELYNQNLISYLGQALYELDYHGIIHIKKKLSFSDFIIDISQIELNTKEDFFIKIAQEEISCLLNISQRTDLLLKISRYYLCMVGYLNHSKTLGKFQGKIGEVPVKTIANTADISSASATRYNALLSSNHLIYIYHSPKFKKTNTYSRYKDMPLCIEYGKLKEERTN